MPVMMLTRNASPVLGTPLRIRASHAPARQRRGCTTTADAPSRVGARGAAQQRRCRSRTRRRWLVCALGDTRALAPQAARGVPAIRRAPGLPQRRRAPPRHPAAAQGCGPPWNREYPLQRLRAHVLSGDGGCEAPAGCASLITELCQSAPRRRRADGRAQTPDAGGATSATAAPGAPPRQRVGTHRHGCRATQPGN